MIKILFEVPNTRGIGEEAVKLWRPDVTRFIESNVARLVQRIRSKLGRTGTSAPGQAPGKVSGEYEKSWSHEMKQFKRATHGRVGSTLWARFGDTLELGNQRIKPRPHVGNTIAAWQREVTENIKANNDG